MAHKTLRRYGDIAKGIYQRGKRLGGRIKRRYKKTKEERAERKRQKEKTRGLKRRFYKKQREIKERDKRFKKKKGFMYNTFTWDRDDYKY